MKDYKCILFKKKTSVGAILLSTHEVGQNAHILLCPGKTTFMFFHSFQHVVVSKTECLKISNVFTLKISNVMPKKYSIIQLFKCNYCRTIKKNHR